MIRRTRKNSVRMLGFEAVEARQLLAVDIEFIYLGDFFDVPERRVALELAAQVLESRLDEPMSEIDPSAPGDSWNARYWHPETGEIFEHSNLRVAENQFIVFAGGRDLEGDRAGRGGPGDDTDLMGSNSFKRDVTRRDNLFDSDFSSWGGSIVFDNEPVWHYGVSTQDLERDERDFFSVAIHELGHALGIGTSDAWFDRIRDGEFNGIPLDAGQGHFAAGEMSDNRNVAMGPEIWRGDRNMFTTADWSALSGIGWDLDGSNLDRTYGVPGTLVVRTEDAAGNSQPAVLFSATSPEFCEDFGGLEICEAEIIAGFTDEFGLYTSFLPAGEWTVRVGNQTRIVTIDGDLHPVVIETNDSDRNFSLVDSDESLLNVFGTDEQDIIRITSDDSRLRVQVNNFPIEVYDRSTIDRIEVAALGGSDELILKFDGQSPIPVNGLHYDGGSGSDESAGGDRLTLDGSYPFLDGLRKTMLDGIHHNVSAPGTGNLELHRNRCADSECEMISFTGLEGDGVNIQGFESDDVVFEQSAETLLRFGQKGGANSFSELTLAPGEAAPGAFVLSNGTLNSTLISSSGEGSFVQSGGTLTAVDVEVDYQLDGGILTSTPGLFGTMAFQDDVDIRGGVVELAIGSTSTFDRLQVDGALTVDGGRLQVEFSVGYLPQIGHQFRVLQSDQISGQFSWVSLPELPSGMGWNRSSLYTTGTLEIGSTVPRIGGLRASSDSIDDSGLNPLTLTAEDVMADAGSVSFVEFWRDTNGNGILDEQIDTKLGRDENSEDGWSWTVFLAGLETGSQTFFARPGLFTFSDLFFGNSAATTVDVVASQPQPTEVFPASDPFVNGSSMSTSNRHVAVSLPNGQYRVVWQDSNDATLTRLFRNSGRPIGRSVRLDEITRWQKADMHVLENGEFVVAYLDGQKVYGQWFRDNAQPASDRVELADRVFGGFDGLHIEVAAANEHATVVYSSGPFVDEDVFGVSFSRNGNITRSAWQMNPAANGSQSHPTIALNESGNGVIAWRDQGNRSIVGRRIRDYGRANDDVFTVFETDTFIDALLPSSAAINAAGEFAIGYTMSDAELNGVYTRLYDANANPRNEHVRVNQFQGHIQQLVDLTMNDLGWTAMTWFSVGQDPGDGLFPWEHGVYARVYKPDGEPAGPEFAVHTDFEGSQLPNGIALDEGSDLSVVWRDTPTAKLYSRRFSVNLAPTLPAQTFVIAENSPIGSSLGQVSGSDPDGDELTYSILGDSPFEIDSNSGMITLSDGSLDFEIDPTIQVTIGVTDDGMPSRTAVGTVTVQLQDVNEPSMIQIGAGEFVYDAGNPWLTIAPNAVISDQDTTDFGGGTLRVEIESGGRPTDRFQVSSPELGILTSEGNAAPLIVEFEESASLSEVQQLIRSIVFSTQVDAMIELRRIKITLTDRDGIAVESEVDVHVLPPSRIIGDSNGDGVFNSSDLIRVFQSGQYEDGVDNNSTFEDGDWNNDGDFDTTDLVLAFQAGTYTVGANKQER